MFAVLRKTRGKAKIPFRGALCCFRRMVFRLNFDLTENGRVHCRTVRRAVTVTRSRLTKGGGDLQA